MSSVSTSTVALAAAPSSNPQKLDLLATMLEASGRGAVPIRRAFLQTAKPGEDGTRRGPLASLINDTATLNTYLLIHALASSSEPFDARYQASAWAIVAGLTRYAEMGAAKSRWSRSVTKLVKLGLIKRDGSGRQVRYVLLHESGDETPYTRPKKLEDGHWFSLPHAYWLDGWEERLSGAEKVMLLIALDSKPGFELPYNRAPSWYGISESTAKRGLSGLVAEEILLADRTWVPDANSKTLWRTVTRYTAAGIWSVDSRTKTMKTKRRAAQPVMFVESGPEAATEAPPQVGAVEK